jgi:broad specificity phosphatase PhoE
MKISYEEKYLKYKKKYLDLKYRLRGGADEQVVEPVAEPVAEPVVAVTEPVKVAETSMVQVQDTTQVPVQNSIVSTNLSDGKKLNILLVSHNARMRCFLDSLKGLKDMSSSKLIDNIMKYKLGSSNEKEIRFMNGAVLKISLKGNSNEGKIELFFQGSVNKRKPGLYFTESEDIPNGNVAFGKYTFDYSASFNIEKLPYDIDFYIVRHGEGTHNVDKSKAFTFIQGKGFDPKLTTNGEKQAEEAGAKLNGIKFDIVFVSRLDRTKQTAYLILEKSNNLNDKTVLTVLPCSHELNYSKSGNCDKANSMIPRAPENISNCEDKKKTYDACTPECCKFQMTKNGAKYGTIVPVEWVEYNNFFYSQTKHHCRDTNMIKEAVQYITAIKSSNKMGKKN